MTGIFLKFIVLKSTDGNLMYVCTTYPIVYETFLGGSCQVAKNYSWTFLKKLRKEFQKTDL